MHNEDTNRRKGSVGDFLRLRLTVVLPLHRRVAKLRSVFTIETVFRHFPLHPRTPDDGLTLEKLFADRDIDLAVTQARMSRLMDVEGLPFGKRTMTYSSRLDPK